MSEHLRPTKAVEPSQTAPIPLAGADETPRIGRHPESAYFWTSAAVVTVAFWVIAAPTLSYPIYASTWALSHAVTTAVYAVNPVVLVIVLVISGNLSDHLGRRRVMLWGLGVALFGTALFAVAPTVTFVFFGRGFTAVGVGLFMSPATAAMVDSGDPDRSELTTAITTAAASAGLIAAIVLGGLLTQYAPYPAHLTFWMLLAALLVVTGFVWRLPARPAEDYRRWRPRPLAIPRGIRRPVAAGALAVAASYGLGGIVLSLGADIATELLASNNMLVNGAVISLAPLFIGLGAIFARGLSLATTSIRGAALAVCGMAVMVWSSTVQSLPAFMLSLAISGIAYSMLFGAGLMLVTMCAARAHRAAALSTLYLVAYIFQGVTALGLGWYAENTSLIAALKVGALIVACMSAGSVVAVAVTRRLVIAP